MSPSPSPLCPRSERLQYAPLGPDTVDDFHRLVQDAHVRRYMMDGTVFPLSWSEQHMRDSQALAARRGVGIWLTYAKDTHELVGFCGFAVLSSLPEPQLLYALFERFTGLGLATEMGRACIATARADAGFDDIVADVDEVNAASVRVLAKLGFARVEVRRGAFGNLLVLRLARPEPGPGALNPSARAVTAPGRPSP